MYWQMLMGRGIWVLVDQLLLFASVLQHTNCHLASVLQYINYHLMYTSHTINFFLKCQLCLKVINYVFTSPRLFG